MCTNSEHTKLPSITSHQAKWLFYKTSATVAIHTKCTLNLYIVQHKIHFTVVLLARSTRPVTKKTKVKFWAYCVYNTWEYLCWYTSCKQHRYRHPCAMEQELQLKHFIRKTRCPHQRNLWLVLNCLFSPSLDSWWMFYCEISNNALCLFLVSCS